MESIKCQKCGRREAVFMRPFSGEKLCKRCLEEVIFKRIKRNLSKTGLLSPKSTIGLVVYPFFVSESLLAYRYLVEIEKKYESKINLIFFEDYDVEEIRKAFSIVEQPKDWIVVKGWKRLFSSKIEYSTLHYYRGLRGAALRAAEREGIDVLVSPACHEYLVFLEISSLLQAREDGLGESSRGLNLSRNIGWVNVFHGVSCTETAFLAYTLDRDFYLWSQANTKEFRWNVYDRYAWRILSDSIGFGSSEMVFSPIKSSLWLKFYSSTPRNCRWCGFPLADKDVCSCCRELRENSIEWKKYGGMRE